MTKRLLNAKEFSVALGDVRNEYITEAVNYRRINCDENIVKRCKAIHEKSTMD